MCVCVVVVVVFFCCCCCLFVCFLLLFFSFLFFFVVVFFCLFFFVVFFFCFFFFSKTSHRYLDFEPSDLKVKLARDIIIPNTDVKLYQNPLINVGTRAMTKFFKKIATVTLILSTAT